MARPRLYYTDHYDIPLPPGHKFPLRKYKLLRESLERSGLFEFQPAPFISLEEALLIHDAGYVQSFIAGTLPFQVIRRIGFPWSPELVKRTLASAGSTLAAAGHAQANGWSGGLAGGTHHAFRAEGAGFCIFNDIAIAIAVLRRSHGLTRFAVVDLDVHQGDGTAKIFEQDQQVFTLSLHGANNFPLRKQKSTVDVEFPDQTTDQPYLAELRRVLPTVWDSNPQTVFFQSGVDGLAGDKLGRLQLSLEGLRQRDELVLTGCRDRSIPCVVVLGGGYSEPIENTVMAHAQTFLLASDVFSTL